MRNIYEKRRNFYLEVSYATFMTVLEFTQSSALMGKTKEQEYNCIGVWYKMGYRQVSLMLPRRRCDTALGRIMWSKL